MFRPCRMPQSTTNSCVHQNRMHVRLRLGTYTMQSLVRLRSNQIPQQAGQMNSRCHSIRFSFEPPIRTNANSIAALASHSQLGMAIDIIVAQIKRALRRWSRLFHSIPFQCNAMQCVLVSSFGSSRPSDIRHCHISHDGRS